MACSRFEIFCVSETCRFRFDVFRVSVDSSFGADAGNDEGGGFVSSIESILDEILLRRESSSDSGLEGLPEWCCFSMDSRFSGTTSRTRFADLSL